MTRTRERINKTTEIEARIARAENRRDIARYHNDAARVAKMEATIEDLRKELKEQSQP